MPPRNWMRHFSIYFVTTTNDKAVSFPAKSTARITSGNDEVDAMPVVFTGRCSRKWRGRSRSGWLASFSPDSDAKGSNR